MEVVRVYALAQGIALLETSRQVASDAWAKLLTGSNKRRTQHMVWRALEKLDAAIEEARVELFTRSAKE